MRVTTAFNKMLALPGARVTDVAFGAEGVIVTVALRAKKPRCSGCGTPGLNIKEHRAKSWRHLDLGGSKWFIECVLRRLYCLGCGDVYEQVPWARAGSPYTRDFEDLTAFLAQQMNQTAVCRLMRIAWRTVGKILQRVVSDKLDHDRLDGLVYIGVDEVCHGNRPPVSHLRRRPPKAPHRVGGARSQRRQLAGVLRSAHRRAEGLDQGRLDRHVRRL